MTTERAPHHRAPRGGTAAALLLGMLSAGCATQEARHGESVDVSKYPPEIREAYKVFAVRCSRCHTLARPLDARINDPQHWIRYVHRMRLQPGSGIDEANAKIILRFLLYYHGQGQSQGGEAPAEPTPPPAPTVPPVLEAPGDGAETPPPGAPESHLQPSKRQPRFGAIETSGAADGRQS
jgi:hypothetical protein